MNPLGRRRWNWLPFDLLQVSTPDESRDADELAQWDQIAARLRDTESRGVRLSAARNVDHLRWARRSRPCPAASLSLSLLATRKAKIKADLGCLKRELETIASEAYDVASTAV